MNAPHLLTRRGSIHFFHGPMFGEKGGEMIRQTVRAQHAAHPKRKPIWLKPELDTHSKRVKSRVGMSRRAETLPRDPIASCARLREIFRTPSIVGIDEVQFLYLPPEGLAVDETHVRLIHDTLLGGMRSGSQIFLAGLDADFRGEPFPLSRSLLLDPRIRREQMTAICAVCCGDATMTQRLYAGKPAPRNMPTVVVKDEKRSLTRYEPRCPSCHQIPD